MQERVLVFEAPSLLVLIPPARQLGGHYLFAGEHVGSEVFGFEPQSLVRLAVNERDPARLHQAQEEPLLRLRVVAPGRHRQQRLRESPALTQNQGIGLAPVEHPYTASSAHDWSRMIRSWNRFRW